MELNEMQVIWNSQKEENMYAFDADTMHRMVQKKAKWVNRDASLNEFGMMAITFFTAASEAREPLLQGDDMHKLFGSAVMLGICLWMFIQRKKRLKRRLEFDSTMLGDLDRAISEADGLLRIASTFQWWFLFPAMLLIVVNLSMAEDPPPALALAGIVGGFLLSIAVVRFGIRCSHIPSKRKLQSLRDILTNEVS